MDYIILALATWRIANLLANEEGPFNLFDKLRARAGVWYEGHDMPDSNSTLGRWLLCVWCSSVAIGAAWTLGYWVAPSITVWIALPFALSTMAIVVDSIIYKED